MAYNNIIYYDDTRKSKRIPVSPHAYGEKSYLIGEGGIYGNVYRLGVDYAIKIPHSDYHGNDVITEIAILKMLNHPNIVSIEGAIIHKNKICIVEKYALMNLHDAIK